MDSLHAPSYSSSYMSLTDIMATEERISCRFERPVVDLGYLDVCSNSSDIQVGTHLDLPFWMARALGSRQRIVSLQTPKIYNAKYRNIMKADASILNLHYLAPHYYELGKYLLPLLGPEGSEIGPVLIKTLKKRLRKIMDTSLYCLEDNASDYRASLDEVERLLFNTGRKTFQDNQLWLSRRSHIVMAAPREDNRNKRKISDIS